MLMHTLYCVTTETHPVRVQHHALQQLALPGARGSPAAAVRPAPGGQPLMRGRGGHIIRIYKLPPCLLVMEVEYIFQLFTYCS